MDSNMDSTPIPNLAQLLAPELPARLKSGVWLFFKRLAPELAECMLCTDDGKKKTYKLAKKSTSGMIAHLRAYHKEQYMLVGDQRNLHSRRGRQCAMIMVDTPSVPPTLFRSDSFLGLFPDIEWPHFPTAAVLTSVILPEMLAEITSKNHADLSGVPVTLLVDSWTSCPTRNRGRVTLTVVLAYFANACWEMEGRLVAIKQSSEDPTPEAVRAVLEQIILNARLDNIVAVVSDSAQNIRSAIESMGYRHPHCANHKLAAAVTRGLVGWEDGEQLLHRLRGFAHDLNEPTNADLRNEYFHHCSVHSLPAVTLPCSSSTRWGSDCRLVEMAVEQMLAINDTLDATGQDRFSDEDMSALAGAATVLKPFGKLGVELAQEGRLLSESLFVLRKLEKHLETCSSASSPAATRSLALSILPHFSTLTPHFFSAPSSLASVFFDPGALFHFKGEINWRNVAASLSPSLASLPSSSSASSYSSPSFCLSSRRAALYGDDDSPPAKIVKKEEAPRAGLDTELLLYLEQSLNGIDVSLEALDFWKSNSDKYPNLSLLARRYLSSPPTSIDAEKVLSAAGLLFRSTLDNLLSNGNAEEICMLRLAKMGSLRVLSSSRDRVIVPSGSVDLAPEEVDEAPEAEEDRDTAWDTEAEERGEAGGRASSFANGSAEVKEELPDAFFPNSMPTPI